MQSSIAADRGDADLIGLDHCEALVLNFTESPLNVDDFAHGKFHNLPQNGQKKQIYERYEMTRTLGFSSQAQSLTSLYFALQRP
jgi:hypothetical protein